MSETARSARDAYARHEWADAYAGFSAARDHGELSADDLSALAGAAWWLGRTDESLSAWDEVYERYANDGRGREAARLALDIGLLWFLRGEAAIGSGWVSRARRLLDDEPTCVEHGHLLFLDVDQALADADFDRAMARAREIQAIARRFADPTLTAFGLVGEGLALVKKGEVNRGLSTLDEAMLPVLAGRVPPDSAGNIYCQLMGICHELGDVRRAREWTDATQRWCDTFSSAVMFAGICRVHRCQLLQLQGDWSSAESEARRACDELAEMNVGAVAESRYQLGELSRLRDDLAGAEQSYLRAHQLGRDPQPGLALLRLAQGQVRVARASINAALSATTASPLARVPLLSAAVEIALAAGDTVLAAEYSSELDEIAAAYGSSGLQAAARQARGSVLLSQQHAADALSMLRGALHRWQRLAAPYHAAQVRAMLAQAYRDAGDVDTAALEFDAAAATFDQLGAAADFRQVEQRRAGLPPPDGLTAREVEVLVLVAGGRSNRDVAAALVLSHRTVARHLSNIFAKIGVSSRTAAAAYAFEHGLATPERG